MAYESAVAELGDLVTTGTCAGCEQELNLLAPHLSVSVKPQRYTLEIVNAGLVGAETDESGQITSLAEVDPESPERYYIGTRSGAAESALVHNHQCLSDWTEKLVGGVDDPASSPKITILVDDPDAAGRSAE
jgi:hypothetical protein